LPKLGVRSLCCVDDMDNIPNLSAAAMKHGTQIECLVEIDCGAGRCGVTTTPQVVALAKAIDAAPGLKFAGLQAYQGAMQHLQSYEERQAKTRIAIDMTRDALEALKAGGLECDIVGGGGTGSYSFESGSGVFNELQCGSYAFVDADDGRILDKNGNRVDRGEWENALFILASVMSHAKADKAIVDAGLKAQSLDSGLPVIFGRSDVEYVKCSDEHGVVMDAGGVLKVNDNLRLVPGHCDPTCNMHDWYVGVRGGGVGAGSGRNDHLRGCAGERGGGVGGAACGGFGAAGTVIASPRDALHTRLVRGGRPSGRPGAFSHHEV